MRASALGGKLGQAGCGRVQLPQPVEPHQHCCGVGRAPTQTLAGRDVLGQEDIRAPRPGAQRLTVEHIIDQQSRGAVGEVSLGRAAIGVGARQSNLAIVSRRQCDIAVEGNLRNDGIQRVESIASRFGDFIQYEDADTLAVAARLRP